MSAWSSPIAPSQESPPASDAITAVTAITVRPAEAKKATRPRPDVQSAMQSVAVWSRTTTDCAQLSSGADAANRKLAKTSASTKP